MQRHFLKVTAHPRLAHKNLLREFLFRFGLEEEPHYKVAEVDLQRMGEMNSPPKTGAFLPHFSFPPRPGSR